MPSEDRATRESTGPARPPSARLLHNLPLLGLLAVLCFYVIGVGPGRLHLLGMDHTFNDQVVYIDAARHLRTEGQLTTGAYYPSTLLQDYGRNYLYMPGHALTIFLSFTLFGDTTFTAILPSLLSYLICLVCLHLLSRRLLGASVGLAAPVLFASIPAYMVYGASAMAELTFLAAGLVSLTVFAWLPVRWRYIAIPALVTGPFLFRETGLIWAIPMLALAWRDPSPGKRRMLIRGIAVLLASIAIAALLYSLDWIGDRPSLLAQNFFGRTFEEKYTDAYALVDTDCGFPAAIPVIVRRFGNNLRGFTSLLARPSFQSLSVHLFLWLPLAAGILGWKNRRLRPLILSWALSAVLFFLLISAFYNWGTFIGLRHLLAPSVLGLLVTGRVIEENRRLLGRAAGAVAMVLLLLAALMFYDAALKKVTEWDRAERIATKAVESIEIHGEGAVVSDLAIGPIYLYANPMATWSLPPANDRTMRLLEERLDVRGVLLFEQSMFWLRVSETALQDAGLTRSYIIDGLIVLREL